MRLNRTSEWKVISIWIFSELPLFNFQRLDMWCAWIWPPCEKFWPFEFLESSYCSISNVSICDPPKSHIRVKSYDHFNFSRVSVVQFRASLYSRRLNRTSVWEVMTIWISRELPFFNFENLDIKCLNRTSDWKVMTIWIFGELPVFNFKRLDMWCAWIGHPSEKLLAFKFFQSFHCSISSISICDAPELDLRVKSFDDLNFSRAPVVQFRTCVYVMHLNCTSEWKVMTISISREFPLFNFEHLYILSAW